MSGTVTSLKPSARECEREAADNLDSSDYDQDIASKLVMAQLNIQANLARQQAKARLTFVDKPKIANESDSMFEHVGHCKPKPDNFAK